MRIKLFNLWECLEWTWYMCELLLLLFKTACYKIITVVFTYLRWNTI